MAELLPLEIGETGSRTFEVLMGVGLCVLKVEAVVLPLLTGVPDEFLKLRALLKVELKVLLLLVGVCILKALGPFACIYSWKPCLIP